MKGVIRIQRAMRDKIIAHAKEEYPNECCGLLAGRDKEISSLYKIENDDKSPDTYFMNPKELFSSQKDMREKELDLIGIYHSHTHSEAFPSKTDTEKALWPGSGLPLFPKAFYLIISLEKLEKPVIKMYDIKKDKIKEKKFRFV